MGMGRMYTAVIDAISVSAVADIWWIKAATNKGIRIHEIVLTQDTSETSEQLPMNIFRTATDNAANGTANTPASLGPSDSAFGGTVRTNITGASLSAETTMLKRQSQNVINGWHYLPTPESRIEIAGGAYLAIKLDAAPAAALPLSGYVVLEELG